MYIRSTPTFFWLWDESILVTSHKRQLCQQYDIKSDLCPANSTLPLLLLVQVTYILLFMWDTVRNECNQVEVKLFPWKKDSLKRVLKPKGKNGHQRENPCMAYVPLGEANQCLLALTANNAYHEEYTIIRLSATHWLGNLRCAETTSCVLLRELSSIAFLCVHCLSNRREIIRRWCKCLDILSSNCTAEWLILFFAVRKQSYKYNDTVM